MSKYPPEPRCVAGCYHRVGPLFPAHAAGTYPCELDEWRVPPGRRCRNGLRRWPTRHAWAHATALRHGEGGTS